MKKLFLLLMAQMLIMPSFAVPTRGLISLSRVVRPFVPFPDPKPKTEPMELFSAYQNLDEIVITSELVSGTVSAVIYNASGAVVESVTEYVSVGGEISISLASLPAGAYILEVSYGDAVYVGEFEI